MNFSSSLLHKIKLKKMGDSHIDTLQVHSENVFFYYLSEEEYNELIKNEGKKKKGQVFLEVEKVDQQSRNKKQEIAQSDKLSESRILESHASHGSRREKLKAAQKSKKEAKKKREEMADDMSQKNSVSVARVEQKSQKSVNIVMQNPKVVQVAPSKKMDKPLQEKAQNSTQETVIKDEGVTSLM